LSCGIHDCCGIAAAGAPYVARAECVVQMLDAGW
jgi:hypothetical protein